MYNKNAAYDLSLFEEKSRKHNVVKINVKKLKKVRALKAKLALMISAATICAGVAMGTAVFISGQATLAELTEETVQLSRKIQEAESVYTQLDMKKKSEISKDCLTSKLENEYGMVKSVNEEYINILNCNKAETKEDCSGLMNIKNQVCEFCNNLFKV